MRKSGYSYPREGMKALAHANITRPSIRASVAMYSGFMRARKYSFG